MCKSSYKTIPIINRFGIVYYEVEIIQKKENEIVIGLSNMDDFYAWSSDGSFIRNEKTIKAFENYHVGDTIGIGYYAEVQSVFFIKNGKYKGCWKDSTIANDDLIPYLKCDVSSIRVLLNTSASYDIRNLPLRYRYCEICTETHNLSHFPKLSCGCSSTCNTVTQLAIFITITVHYEYLTNKIELEPRISLS